MTERNAGLAHCCHHDTHWEYCYDYAERVEYIKAYKPEGERELRLRLFQLVPEEILPGKDSDELDASDKAWAAYVKAEAASDKAWAAYVKARDAYLSRYQPELDALHDKLFPDCTWDGKTIFGRSVK